MEYGQFFIVGLVIQAVLLCVIVLLHSAMRKDHPYRGFMKVLIGILLLSLFWLLISFIWQLKEGWISLLALPFLCSVVTEAPKERVTPMHLVITGITAGVCAVLALFAIILIPIPGLPAASGFWIPAGFYFVFTLWFGVWGALGGHIATWLGMSYFAGFTLHVWADGAVGDFIAPMVCLLLFKKLFRADPELKTRKDWVAWIISVPIASLTCGLWVHTVNLLFGVITWPFWWVGVITYFLGDSAAVFIVGTPLLKTLSKYAKTAPVYVKGILT